MPEFLYFIPIKNMLFINIIFDKKYNFSQFPYLESNILLKYISKSLKISNWHMPGFKSATFGFWVGRLYNV